MKINTVEGIVVKRVRGRYLNCRGCYFHDKNIDCFRKDLEYLHGCVSNDHYYILDTHSNDVLNL